MRLLVLLMLAGCTHTHAWVIEKSPDGGRIGYARDTMFNDRGSVVRDFRTQAAAVCGAQGWTVVKEVIPFPSEAVPAAGEALRGHTFGAAVHGGAALHEDGVSRAPRMNPDAPTEYAAFTSWNEAEIRCAAH